MGSSLSAGGMPAPALPVINPATIPGVSLLTRQALRVFYRVLTAIHPPLAARAALVLFTTPSFGLLTRSERALRSGAECIQLRHRDFRLQVFTWDGPGPTVLVAHGWSSRALRQSFLIERLLAAGFRVIAFDAPGHGGSSRMRSDVSLFVEAMRAIVEHVGVVHAIVGYSLGARAALLLLESSCIPQIRALGVLATPPDVRYMLEQFKVVLGLDAEVCALLDSQLRRERGNPDVHRPQDVTHLLRPVLVIHDTHDDVAPIAHARSLAAQLAMGQLHVTRALNHCGVLTDPAALSELVRFLTVHCVGDEATC